MAETYLKAHRYDPRTDPQMLERLKTTAEDIKMVLSTAETHTVVLKEFGHGAAGSSINYTFTMTRRDLDHMITPLVDRSFKVTQDALSLARLTPTAFDKIILVGGSTRMPLVRKRVEAFFGQAPLDRVNPDEVVAIGAAIQAAALTEGARKRSIPAPPSVIGKPRTLPGITNDANENTQTGSIDPAALQGKPPPAFASGPPSFGFHPASSPPPGGPATKSGPPPSGATGARLANNTQVGGPRKITSPGVAPNTQPMGARSAEAPTSPGFDDDPSIASFPDLAVPTPFEWFPSSGQPSSGETGVRSGPAGSERSFGGNTLTATGVEQSTLTSSVGPSEAVTLQPSAPRPAAGAPSSSGRDGFGAIDEPPSLMSMPDTSVPSFPSMTGGASSGMPSPIGEPERFEISARGDSVPDGQFGAVRDLSLISTTGMSTSSGSPSSAELGFGQLPDLSLVSTSSATSEVEDVTQARARLLESIEDETERGTEVPVKGVPGGLGAELKKPVPNTTLNLAARSPSPLLGNDETADLPSVAQPTDLPSLVGGRKRPEIRKPGQPGMNAAGGPSMIGKPPPMLAPQPFGPMEKIGADGPPSRTAALQARPSQPGQAGSPAPASSRNVLQGQPRTGAQPARTGAMPARSGPGAPPVNTTLPLNQQPPQQQPPQQQPPFNQTAPLNQPPPQQQQAQQRPAPFGTGLPTAAFGSVPPAQAFGSASPPAGVPTAPMNQASPGMNPAYQSTPSLSPHGAPAPQRQAPPPQQPPPQMAPPQAQQQQQAFGAAPAERSLRLGTSAAVSLAAAALPLAAPSADADASAASCARLRRVRPARCAARPERDASGVQPEHRGHPRRAGSAAGLPPAVEPAAVDRLRRARPRRRHAAWPRRRDGRRLHRHDHPAQREDPVRAHAALRHRP